MRKTIIFQTDTITNIKTYMEQNNCTFSKAVNDLININTQDKFKAEEYIKDTLHKLLSNQSIMYKEIKVIKDNITKS